MHHLNYYTVWSSKTEFDRFFYQSSLNVTDDTLVHNFPSENDGKFISCPCPSWSGWPTWTRKYLKVSYGHKNCWETLSISQDFWRTDFPSVSHWSGHPLGPAALSARKTREIWVNLRREIWGRNRDPIRPGEICGILCFIQSAGRNGHRGSNDPTNHPTWWVVGCVNVVFGWADDATQSDIQYISMIAYPRVFAFSRPVPILLWRWSFSRLLAGLCSSTVGLLTNDCLLLIFHLTSSSLTASPSLVSWVSSASTSSSWSSRATSTMTTQPSVWTLSLLWLKLNSLQRFCYSW